MDLLSSAQPTTPSPTTNMDPMDHAIIPSAEHIPLSPPASPVFPLHDARVSHYTKPNKPPRFPRHPCPTAHYTLSLLDSEHQAQRLFGKSFTLRSPVTGELLGPFALLSYTDAWIPMYCKYIHKVVSTPLFTLRERELIVLAVAGVTRAEYVVYAHRRIAAAAGLDEDVVEAALKGCAWMEMLDLSAREKNVYRLAAEMARSWGRVGDATWDAVVAKDKPKAKAQEGWLETGCEPSDEERVRDGNKPGSNKEDEPFLTREEVATLAQVLASTLFVSVLVNCADVEVPRCEDEIAQQP